MRPFNIENVRNRIFVTGLPRSGTTFVGKVLSMPLSVDYIHEPFNPSCGLPELTQRYVYLRPGLEDPESKRYHTALAALFRYEGQFRTALYERDSFLKRALKLGFGSRGQIHFRLAKINPFHSTVVVKDPTAFLLTEFLVRHFKVKPVIVIRHPCSLIPSWQRLGFDAEFHYLLEQKALVEDYGYEQLVKPVQNCSDQVERIAFFWRVVHKILLQQASAAPDWRIVTHESLSAHPDAGFRKLYQDLGLPWSCRIESRILRLTRDSNPAEARSGKPQDFRRNSAAIFGVRRDSLSKDHRRRVYEVVGEVAKPYYDRESFAID